MHRHTRTHAHTIEVSGMRYTMTNGSYHFFFFKNEINAISFMKWREVVKKKKTSPLLIHVQSHCCIAMFSFSLPQKYVNNCHFLDFFYWLLLLHVANSENVSMFHTSYWRTESRRHKKLNTKNRFLFFFPDTLNKNFFRRIEPSIKFKSI